MMFSQYRSTSSPPPPSEMLTISTLELVSRLTLELARMLTLVSFQTNLGVILTIYQTMTMIMMQPPLIQLSQHELSFSRRESCNSRLIYDKKYVNLESSRITFLRISREIHASRHSSPKFEKCNSRIKPPFSHSRLI